MEQFATGACVDQFIVGAWKKLASAKFLEEALSTDVDESAVNAVVGSLETQLVTSTPAVSGHQVSSASVSQQNHQVNSGISNGGIITAVQPQKLGVSNGGSATAVNSMMNQEVTKPITTSPLLPVNVVASNTMAPQVTTQQRSTTDNTKEKCREFLADLLELSSREPKVVERNVRTLIQELIDTDVEPAEFCDRPERLLNASLQSCLIGFLKKSLPLLRKPLVTKEVFPVTSTSSVVTQTVAATITTATTTPSTVTAAASSTPTPPVQSPLGDKRQSQFAD